MRVLRAFTYYCGPRFLPVVSHLFDHPLLKCSEHPFFFWICRSDLDRRHVAESRLRTAKPLSRSKLKNGTLLRQHVSFAVLFLASDQVPLSHGSITPPQLMPSSSELRFDPLPPGKLPERHAASPAEILVFADYYLPGFKAGGPIRSLANIVERLGDVFTFRVVTRDRDHGDTQPYAGIEPNTWHSIGKAKVLHLSHDRRSARTVRSLIADGHSRVVYLNSLFSPVFTIQTMALRRAGVLPRIPFIVAPRGEFSPSALQLKRTKKASYLALARAMGLYKDVLWQASSAAEERDIRRWCGAAASVFVVPNVAVANAGRVEGAREVKRPGQIKIVFVSRVDRMKNLDAALQMLSKVIGRIEFNIYGPISDQAYWNTCAKTISALPSTVSVHYHGAIGQERVAEVLSANHLFLMPSLGESYGHAIVEALSAGCPVLISDRTPWRGLEAKQVGWDIALERSDLFHRVLQTCIDMDDATYQRWSDNARAYATSLVDQDVGTRMIHTLFERALAP